MPGLPWVGVLWSSLTSFHRWFDTYPSCEKLGTSIATVIPLFAFPASFLELFNHLFSFLVELVGFLLSLG